MELHEDKRNGPRYVANKLTPQEQKQIVDVALSEEYRDIPVKQLVVRLADQGKYIASESTFYRVLREEGLVKERRSVRTPQKRKKKESHLALGPNQLWSWDITYLPSFIKGKYFYLYMFVDVFSRKIVGWRIEEEESSELAAELVEESTRREGIQAGKLVLHSDNGGPMKGSTMLFTLEKLGVSKSFSRPSVSNDNPYSESLFKTAKYCPTYPKRLESLEQWREWAESFVFWYNETHLHSGIRYVTPSQRHLGKDRKLLSERRRLWEKAKKKHPERWGGRKTRNWGYIEEVHLNPEKKIAA